MSLGQINKFNFWSTSEITEEDKRSFVSFASMLANGSFQERITLDNLNTNINEVSTFVSEIYKKNYEIWCEKINCEMATKHWNTLHWR